MSVWVRNTLYDRGWAKVKRLPVPVVSVGNISVGGSGKTSLVKFLASELSKDIHVAVLLRGYKRKSRGVRVVSQRGKVFLDVKEAGDEAYMLAKTLPSVSVVVCEDRYAGGLVAVRELGAELLLLDDGFQHRKLFRDLDLVLLRKRDTSAELLPAGPLREPLRSLRRAHAVILSYQEIEPFEFDDHERVFKMFREFRTLLRHDFSRAPVETLMDREVIAFAGLGSNDQFFKTLRRLGFKVKKEMSFPDHHDYGRFKLRDTEVYLTTPKDMVKLPPAENLFALEPRVRVEGLVPFVKEHLQV